MPRLARLLPIVVLAAAAFAPPAGAATFGSDLSPAPSEACAAAPGDVCSFTARTTPAGTAFTGSPQSGVLVKVRVRYATTAPVDAVLRVLRSAGGDDFLNVAPETPVSFAPAVDAVREVALRRHIAAGDRIGVAWTRGAESMMVRGPHGAATCYERTMPHPQGEVRTYVACTDEVLIEATVEADADSDGFGDETQDNCPTAANADQANLDGDALGDACDTDDDNDGTADGSDAFPRDRAESVDTDGDGIGNNADGDDDNDGVADGSDAFPLNRAESVDTDGDGIGNNADVDDDGDGLADATERLLGTDPLRPDTDGDGRPDNRDNCPTAVNADQANADGATGGDVCDQDDDDDGLRDDEELARGSNRADLDSDDDGIRDADEVRRTRTHPARRDSDRDGLTDGLEIARTQPIADPPGAVVGTDPRRFVRDRDPRTRTDPLKPDTDREKLKDGREDANRNGRRDRLETDPRRRDTDGDRVDDRRDRRPLDRRLR